MIIYLPINNVSIFGQETIIFVHAHKLGKIDNLGPKMKISRPLKIELSYFDIKKIIIFLISKYESSIIHCLEIFILGPKGIIFTELVR